MRFTTFPIGWFAAFALSGIAAAQLPGIDAPAGARSGTDAQSKIEGSGPIKDVGVGATETEPKQGTMKGGEPRGTVSPPRESRSLKNPAELCERLAGTERTICLQQSRENRERALAPDVGATPKAGSGGAAPGNVPRVR
jgi:hypothetical protein